MLPAPHPSHGHWAFGGLAHGSAEVVLGLVLIDTNGRNQRVLLIVFAAWGTEVRSDQADTLDPGRGLGRYERSDASPESFGRRLEQGEALLGA